MRFELLARVLSRRWCRWPVRCDARRCEKGIKGWHGAFGEAWPVRGFGSVDELSTGRFLSSLGESRAAIEHVLGRFSCR
jgi:hypothetical protein